MTKLSMPAGHIPAALDGLRPKLAEAAMTVYSEWDQVDGHDEVLGMGGICQDVAAAMVDALAKNGFEHAMSIHASVGENHVFVVALIPGDGVYEIDIPPSTYEVGSGYVWQKRENIVIEANDVVIGRIADDMDPQVFEEAYGTD